jgi:hypothetical protein
MRTALKRDPKAVVDPGQQENLVRTILVISIQPLPLPAPLPLKLPLALPLPLPLALPLPLPIPIQLLSPTTATTYYWCHYAVAHMRQMLGQMMLPPQLRLIPLWLRGLALGRLLAKIIEMACTVLRPRAFLCIRAMLP